jgi:hypothetical protein
VVDFQTTSVDAPFITFEPMPMDIHPCAVDCIEIVAMFEVKSLLTVTEKLDPSVYVDTEFVPLLPAEDAGGSELPTLLPEGDAGAGATPGAVEVAAKLPTE